MKRLLTCNPFVLLCTAGALLLLTTSLCEAFSVRETDCWRRSASLPSRSTAVPRRSSSRICHGTVTVTDLYRKADTCAPSNTKRYAANTNNVGTTNDDDDGDTKKNEIERLRSMAARLRAEAAALEAEQAQQLADAAERAFAKFDTNRDGVVSVEELKAGLEKSFKTELSDSRVKQLMEDFDRTGDGTLQLEEFVGVDQFRNKIDSLAREEREAARKAAAAAKLEEEAAKFLQAQMEILNEKPPTTTDRFVSILPYLFPILDGLQFARFLVVENSDNVLATVAAILYGLYRSVPFGGLIAFFALTFLSGNPRINRLIRFNMQQAIYLDISLFFFGIVGVLYASAAKILGFQLPASATELGSDAVFAILLLAALYCVISSLLGYTPDKLPIISDVVNDRMPTLEMFDAEGRFIGRPTTSKKDDNDDNNGDKNNDETK